MMELIIDIWKIVSVVIGAFIIMRLIVIALASKGFISASDQINENFRQMAKFEIFGSRVVW